MQPPCIREAAVNVKTPRSVFLVERSLQLLDGRSKRLYAVVVAAQMLISFLDLAAALLLGLVVAGASRSVLDNNSTPTSSHFDALVPTDTRQLVTFAAIAGLLLLTKSLTSLFLTRRTYRFLANRSAQISSRLANTLLSLPLTKIQGRESQRLTQALTSGVNAATVNTLGPFATVLSESVLVAILIGALWVIDPLVAVFTILLFGLVALILQLALGRWAVSLGIAQASADIGSMTELQHSLRAYRELVVSHRRAHFIDRFGALRWKSASVLADTFILSQAGKYVFESALILGAGGLVVALATTRTLESALIAMSVFLLVAARVSPSLLRLQTAFSQLRNSEGVSHELFDFLTDLEDLDQMRPELQAGKFVKSELPFIPRVELTRVSFTYPDAQRAALHDVSLVIEPGQSVAIVGATGSGKSTLADIILGVLHPTAGSALISGIPSDLAVARWPGQCAYVPQETALLSGTVRENVALGLPSEEIDDESVRRALSNAHLGDFLVQERDGLSTLVGENGVKLSGGQQQRLGLARALYSSPSLLVMDEATSALDAQTERLITQTIEDISREITLVIIAHRLVTVRSCSTVIYLDKGRIAAAGTFHEIRQEVPDFDRQAQLMGL